MYSPILYYVQPIGLYICVQYTYVQPYVYKMCIVHMCTIHILYYVQPIAIHICTAHRAVHMCIAYGKVNPAHGYCTP